MPSFKYDPNSSEYCFGFKTSKESKNKLLKNQGKYDAVVKQLYNYENMMNQDIKDNKNHNIILFKIVQKNILSKNLFKIKKSIKVDE